MRYIDIFAITKTKPKLKEPYEIEKGSAIVPKWTLSGLNHRSHLRKCSYSGRGKYHTNFDKFYFHRWFQEGGQLEQNGDIDVGAILETEEGNIIKVWDIEKIKFEVEELQ